MDNIIKARITSSIEVKEKILRDENLLNIINQVVKECVSTFENNRKILFCGNGGSAADAQHLAAEFSGRFYYDRPPLYAEALHVNTSFITAVANDYSFDEVYARMIRASGNPGDILFAISTSGKSNNILRALEEANDIGMITVGMTGDTGGKMTGLCQYLMKIPSTDTPRIQEAHILIGHIICELVETQLFPRS